MEPSGGPGAPGRLAVGVVGAGRVGAVLGNALRAVGHTVVGASGVSAVSRERIDTLLPGVPVLTPDEVVSRAEVVLLAVPDDALPELVGGLAALGTWRPGQIVAHTAGRFGTDVLAPARAAGAIPMALHPAMTFTGTSLDLARLVECPVAVTAPTAVLPIAQALVLEIGAMPVVLPEEARPAYHAALAHGANHLVTLVAQAERVLAAAGIEEPGALLAPLLTAALDGVLRGGEAGLTGPVVRGDAGTLAEHARALAALAAEDERLVDVLPTYRALARATAQRALVRGVLSSEHAQALLDVLALDPTHPADPAHPLAERGVRGPSASRTTPNPAFGKQGNPAFGKQGGPGFGEGEGPVVAATRDELAMALASLPGRRAVVMTMGALHDGHLELVRQAHAHADHVVVTIFVNPLQFGAGEDLERYPRTLEADLAALAPVGVDLVFAPPPEVVYPAGEPVVRVQAGPLGEVWEGAARPGHFDGVLTVVLKLLHLTRPDVAVFGQKDAQQLAVVRRMVRDLDVPVEVVAVPIRRDRDGLALSSRNAYLSAAERTSALVLPRALAAAQPAADAAPPGRRAPVALAAAQRVLDAAGKAEPGAVVVDYVTLIDPDSLAPVEPGYRGTALLAVAATVGRTRLIDNVLVDLDGAGARPDPPEENDP